ncbi:hypothetical protein F2Q70_00011255 [Brassica cretica]|uniref:Uncharacterized protein n=1 Tax=Brassica cretica TaxID=69181 RepID=A0A8S9M230_BRACR|nr:hypothetical protein F2Q70_00011255 [Brassica cretica]
MDPASEVKKRERLTKCILKLKDNKLTRVRIESSGSKKPRMLQKSLMVIVDKSGYRNWTKELSWLTKLDRLGITVLILSVLASMETESFQDVAVYHRVFCPDVCGETESCQDMYLPRHNCTVTGTQGVHYCGFPIAMKAWMGTSESFPSHDCRTTESPKGKLCKGSRVGSTGFEPEFAVSGIFPQGPLDYHRWFFFASPDLLNISRNACDSGSARLSPETRFVVKGDMTAAVEKRRDYGAADVGEVTF